MRKVVIGTSVALTGVVFAWGVLCLPQFGARAGGERLERMNASPNFLGGKAQNVVFTKTATMTEMMPVVKEYLDRGVERFPTGEIPIVRPDPETMILGEGLHLTWMGHSSMLLDLDGTTVLTDPVFSERASPFESSGPLRFHPTPLAVEELPPIDVVLLSHDHYDHLDHATIAELASRDTRFVAPLGVGAHLESWGVPAENITELDWGESVLVNTVRFHCTPARHFSGRGLADRNNTLWASWAMVGPEHRVWFSGDTGPFEEAAAIGEEHGPFDLTMIEIGAWNAAWGDVHLGPEGALEMHELLGGAVMMPIHWGTFELSTHAWDQPIQKVQELAEERGVTLLSPLPGQRVSPAAPEVARFWKDRT
ncbi:MAG TPA: MBL fold metallo-hydrolase [Myxococcota bacterium]|nr:MBL fold metallo-hydrolase [Myxococcota bacterium]